jgi:DNA-binding MurR/RpiR family transcriptional regulator
MERDLVGPDVGQASRLTVGSWDRMRALLALRAEQGELSTIERRIADYIVENPLSVRGQSSQQLATTLAVSQSSVVKFAKRLGFRGYPDMKLSITEALARDAVTNGPCVVSHDPDVARAEALSRGKAAADDETRALTPPELLDAAARRLAAAETLYIAGGDGGGGLAALAFASHVTALGRRCIVHTRAAALRAGLLSARASDALLLVCDQCEDPAWLQACREMRAVGGAIVAVTRQRTEALAGTADACLMVSAQAAAAHVAELIYESAVRQMLDDLYLRLIAMQSDAASTGAANRQPLAGRE